MENQNDHWTVLTMAMLMIVKMVLLTFRTKEHMMHSLHSLFVVMLFPGHEIFLNIYSLLVKFSEIAIPKTEVITHDEKNVECWNSLRKKYPQTVLAGYSFGWVHGANMTNIKLKCYISHR